MLWSVAQQTAWAPAFAGVTAVGGAGSFFSHRSFFCLQSTLNYRILQIDRRSVYKKKEGRRNMRTVKKPDIRKNEILDAAETLFSQKGYAKTTVNDILSLLGIAKGTFYHYFTSKEELMEAMVARAIDSGLAAVEALADDAALSAEDKLRLIITAPEPETAQRDALAEELHQANNAELHLHSLLESVRRLTPVVTRIVEQGIAEGTFSTPCPKETVELLLVASQFLLDTGLFGGDEAALISRAHAFAHVMETSLAARPGAFSYLPARYEAMIANMKQHNHKRDAQ
jgi:AcrR family transcriptional regulator